MKRIYELSFRERFDLGPPPKSVLLAMAWWADDEGLGVFPGVDRLCDRTELGKRTILRSWKQLEEAGLLEYLGRHPETRTKCWRICLPKPVGAPEAPAKKLAGAGGAPETHPKVPQSHVKGARGAPYPLEIRQDDVVDESSEGRSPRGEGESYRDRLLADYETLPRRGDQLTEADADCADAWRLEGLPLELVRAGVLLTRYRLAGSSTKVRTLAYCRGAVEELSSQDPAYWSYVISWFDRWEQP